MLYSDLFLKKKNTVPFWLVLPLAVIIIGVAVALAMPTARNSQATRKDLTRIEIANMVPHQATIVWETAAPEADWILYGTSLDSLNQTAFDDRQLEKNPLATTLHYATIKNLENNTKYYFRLTDGKAFLDRNNDGFFSFTTIRPNAQINNLKPAYGKLVDDQGNPVSDALVMLNIKNAYLIATYTKSSGEWLLPLNYIIDKTTSLTKAINDREQISITFSSENKKQSIVKASLNAINPLQSDVILGQNMNLQSAGNVLSATSGTNMKKSYVFDLSYPKDKSLIPTNQPLIKGTSLPFSSISIVVRQQNKVIYTQTVVADSTGMWKNESAPTLTPGQYSITIKTKNQAQSDLSLTKSFTIAKSGESVLAAATPEASVTPSTTIVSPTVTPALQVTVTAPPVTPSTTAISPTIITTATPVASPSGTIKTPVTGINTTTTVIISMLLMLAGLGVLLVI
jgi:type II secretory pathway pseudopilin PulG